MATLAGRSLPAKARARGLRVIEWPGWEGKSEGSFDARGVLLHHDAMALGYVDKNLGNNLNVVKNMSAPGANGAQLWIGLDTSGQMTLVFMKSGRANHAGSGAGFRSIPGGQGNYYCIGIETDHTTGTGWPAEMIRYIDVTTILLCEEFGIDPDRWLAGHKEYAPGRKPDPESFDLNAWRARVKNRTPWGGDDKPKEWDDLATKEEIRQVVAEEVAKRVTPQIINDVVANVLRAPEFRLSLASIVKDRQADVFNATAAVLHAPEFAGWQDVTRRAAAVILKEDPPATQKTYTVVAGDTLGSIARKFGVTVEELVEWNGISDPNNISVGQVLKVSAPKG